MKKDALGDRMKGYENVTRYKATRRMPLLVRVDGKAFHTLTRKANKPFDRELISAMVHAAYETAKEMQGFKACYVQSDEVTFLLTDDETLTTDAWFDNNIQKIASITASFMSVHFNHYLGHSDFRYDKSKPPVFDARVFSVPKEDVVNCFLWRAKDWKRNSLSMYCQSIFSHKKLHGKNQATCHALLEEIGKSWHEDLTDKQKYGTFFYKYKGETKTSIIGEHIPPDYEMINEVIGKFL